MSRLVLHAFLGTLLQPGSTKSFLCQLSDEIGFSSRIGETIIIVEIAEEQSPGYVAIGKLKGFVTEPDGSTAALVEQIQPFTSTIGLLHSPMLIPGISELSDTISSRIFSIASTGTEEDHFARLVETKPLITEHLRKSQSDRCGFSDVATDQGQAFMIQPIEHGGRWHTSNFLFLDPEPGARFADFSWTVGPGLELIVDMFSTGAGIAETANRGGTLALRETIDVWPDPDALAWHRDQFFSRRR